MKNPPPLWPPTGDGLRHERRSSRSTLLTRLKRETPELSFILMRHRKQREKVVLIIVRFVIHITALRLSDHLSHFKIKLMHSLLNPSLQRRDQGKLSNDSAAHYPSVLSETLKRDRTFGPELRRCSKTSKEALWERNLSDSKHLRSFVLLEY